MDWISAGDLSIPFGFLVDEVSVTMMCVVTLERHRTTNSSKNGRKNARRVQL